MALPWTAPGFGQGIYPGDAPFYVPRPVDPSIIAEIARQRAQQQQQISGGIQNAIESVGKYMEQKQRDDIANQLMAQANAPRPGVVSWPSLETTGATDQLTPPEMAQNTALGYGTKPTTPDLGGLFGFQLRQEQAKNQFQEAYRQAQIAHLGRLGYPSVGGSGPDSSTPPTVDQSTGLIWNGRQWVKPPSTGRIQPTVQNKTTTDMGSFGLQPGDLDNLDTSKTDIIPPKGNAGQKINVVTRDGRQATVPWATWQRWTSINKLNQGDVNQAASVIGNQAPLPSPDVPAAPNYSQSIPTGTPAPSEQLGKPLDTETAKSILAEAGGDKEKARLLAKQRGYVF